MTKVMNVDEAQKNLKVLSDRGKEAIAETKKVLHKLTDEQKTELERQETRIEKAQEAFFDVVDALETIQREELWKEGYASFQSYLRGRWEMSAPMVSNYLNAVVVISALKKANAEKLPTNEGQTRALARLLPKGKDKDKDTKKLIQFWAKVSKKEGKITAQSIIEAMGNDKGKGKISHKVSPPAQKAKKGEVVITASSNLRAIADSTGGRNPMKGVVIVKVETFDDLASVFAQVGTVVRDKKIESASLSFSL